MNSTPLPLVTVYIATRNRRQLLYRALSSVRRQHHTNIEILVVDDGSDDDTPELLRALAEDGVLRWFRNEQCKGACAARNLALREAHGHYITGLDDDDEMLPGRVGMLLEALHPEDAFVCASDRILGADGVRESRMPPECIDLDSILSRNVVGNQVLAKREKVLACGGFDEALPAAQDYDLWIRMILQHGPARGIRQPLQVVHAHADGTRISRSPERRSGYWKVYRKHRSLMSRSARATHLYNLHKASRKRLGSGRARIFFVPGNRLRLLSRMLSERIPAFSVILRKIADSYVRFAMR